MKTVDQIFGWLLVAASLAHGGGSYVAYAHKPELLLWAEAAALAGLLLAALNLLRAGRPADRVLGWVCAWGCIGWLLVVFAFGRLIGNLFDFRVLIHASVTLALLGFSLRTALRKAPVIT